MRELKFRAYIKDLEDYGRVISLLFGNKDEVESALVEVMYSNGSIERLDVPKENLILEQYTGLMDKNGKEVYEKDILRFENRLFEIGWNNHRAGFGFVPIKNCDFTMDFSLSKCEVIGNIHENAELLIEE